VAKIEIPEFRAAYLHWQRRRAFILVLVGSGLRPSRAQRAAQEQARAELDPDGTAEIPPVDTSTPELRWPTCAARRWPTTASRASWAPFYDIYY